MPPPCICQLTSSLLALVAVRAVVSVELEHAALEVWVFLKPTHGGGGGFNALEFDHELRDTSIFSGRLHLEDAAILNLAGHLLGKYWSHILDVLHQKDTCVTVLEYVMLGLLVWISWCESNRD